MKEGLTEVLAVLDESAQAQKIAGQIVTAYNDLLADLKKNGEVVWTTVRVGAGSGTEYDRVKIKGVKKLIKKDFSTSGKAALFDTVGAAIDRLGVTLSETPEESRPSKVLVFIASAGIDEVSRTYTFDDIKAKIEHQQRVYSWEFIFAGTDIPAYRRA
jgi:hypothetical protein